MGQSYYRRCAHLTWQYNLYCQILLITQGPQVCKDDTVLKCRPLVSLGHAIPDIAQTHREGTVAQLPKMPLHFKLRMAIPSTRVGTSILPFNLGPFRQPQLQPSRIFTLSQCEPTEDIQAINSRQMGPKSISNCKVKVSLQADFNFKPDIKLEQSDARTHSAQRRTNWRAGV